MTTRKLRFSLALKSLLSLAVGVLATPALAAGLSSTVVLTITTPATITYGQIVDGYAQANASDGSPLTGTITFYDGATSICQIPADISANCPPSAGTGFTAGTHTLTAVYSGDATHSGSTSNAVTIAVLPAATTAAITTSASPAAPGQPITFTATLQSPYATPIGPVTFYDNTTPIATTTLNSSGIATFTTSTLQPGTHAITAIYNATQNFTASTSPVFSEVIQNTTPAAATAIMLSSTANPAITGESITLTANVVPIGPSLKATTGPVTFYDNTTVIGTASLNSSGLATISTSTLTAGTHYLTAAYAGDTFAAPSTSSAFAQVVNAPASQTAPGFTITTSSISVTIGQTANVTVTVSPLNGFNQPVQLGCANLPTEATCTFTTATLPAGGGTTTLKLTTSAPRACGSSIPYGQSASLPFAGPVLAGLIALCLPRRNKALRTLLTLLIAACTITAITGCGACTDLGTKPGNYTFQITGTAAGATQITTSKNVAITVIP